MIEISTNPINAYRNYECVTTYAYVLYSIPFFRKSDAKQDLDER